MKKRNKLKQAIYYKIVMFMILWCVCPLHTAYDLSNVQDITAYADSMPEFPENQNDDPYAPLFTSFNQSHAISYFDKLMHFFGMRKLLDIDDFIATMRNVTQERELNGYFGNFVEKYYISDTSQWFFWGDFYGALHAQASWLQYLKEHRIINDSLELIKADTYLVFNDTARVYTPYGIESLWIMLKLLQKNPTKVILLKTSDQFSDKWQQDALVDAFYTRFNRPRILIKHLIEAFIKTLPEAIYLVGDDDNIIKITAGAKVADVLWDQFFQERVNGIFHNKHIVSSAKSIPLRGVLNIHPAVRLDQQKMPALQHSNQKGIDVWSLISSPIKLFKTEARIHQDAFLQLNTQKHFLKWQLLLYGQSTHDRKDFQLVRSYDLLSGSLRYSSDAKEYIKVLEQQIATVQQEVQQARVRCKENNEHVTSFDPE